MSDMYKDIEHAPAKKHPGRVGPDYFLLLRGLPVNKYVAIPFNTSSEYESKRSSVRRWIVRQMKLVPGCQYETYMSVDKNLVVARLS